MAPPSIRGLPASINGLPLHTRSLTVQLRAAGPDQWRARGDVIDLRKNGFVPTSYDIQPAGVIHSMSIELDLDPTTLRMDAIRIDQPFVAVEASEATRGECCRDPAPRLIELTGECLDDDRVVLQRRLHALGHESELGEVGAYILVLDSRPIFSIISLF